MAAAHGRYQHGPGPKRQQLACPCTLDLGCWLCASWALGCAADGAVVFRYAQSLAGGGGLNERALTLLPQV